MLYSVWSFSWERIWSIPPSHPKQPAAQTKTVEGWTLLISDELLEKDKAPTERALELLTVQLQEIVRVVPAAAVVELRKVPPWLSPEYPKVHPRAEYHSGADWLRDNKRDPAMEKHNSPSMATRANTPSSKAT